MTRPRGRMDVLTDGADILYEAGYSLAEIAAAMDSASRTVMKHLVAAGVEIRPRGAPTGAISRPPLGELRRDLRNLRWRFAEEAHCLAAAFVARMED